MAFLDFTIVDNVQCSNFSAGQLRNCSCPNMGICSANSPNICVASLRNQCRLMHNSCELEKARCKGEGKFYDFTNDKNERLRL